jgi:hypothetical protein
MPYLGAVDAVNGAASKAKAVSLIRIAVACEFSYQFPAKIS